MPNIKTLNQERARFALEKVQNIKSGKDKLSDKDKFSSNAKRLPALITTNGLIPTLAFLKSKGETEPVYNTMNEWLKQKGFTGNNSDVLEYLLNCDFSTLRLATMEAMAFANWLKRIVEIEIKEGIKYMTNNKKINKEEKSKWFIVNISIWYGNSYFKYNKDIEKNKEITKLNENIFEDAFSCIKDIDNYIILLNKLLPIFNVTKEEFKDNKETGNRKNSFDKDSDIECIGGVSKIHLLKKLLDKYEVKKEYLNNINNIKENLIKFNNNKLNENNNGYYLLVYDNSHITDTPLICGLGATHVLETAITLHHIWGFPYIPASSLKGVCREVAFWNLVEKKKIDENKLIDFQKKFYGDFVVDDEDILAYQLLFGAQDFKGLLLFLDAYPETNNNEKIFKLDIMNPHYSGYYGDKDGKIPPGDWENPTPIFFLTVKEGVKFRFTILFDKWRWEKIKEKEIILNTKKINIKNVSVELEKIINNNNFFENILKEALSFYGVGSKTRLGYGNFKV